VSTPARRPCAVSRAALLVAGFALLSAGCGSKMGRVSGTVSLPDGKPLPGGIITFVPDKGNPASSVIKEDGTYELEVRVGDCKVSVDNRSAGVAEKLAGRDGTAIPKQNPAGSSPPRGAPNLPAGVGGRPRSSGPPASKDADKAISDAMKDKAPPPSSEERVKVPGKAVKINTRYHNPETSGLTFAVGGDPQTFDVKLAR
jgi:hypothetical protein